MVFRVNPGGFVDEAIIEVAVVGVNKPPKRCKGPCRNLIIYIIRTWGG